MFVLAHLSDPHLSPQAGPRLRELAGKRALGLLNWRMRRRFEHRTDVLDAVLADLATQTTDHIAVTGDLVNLALPGEFAAARTFLERVGPPERVSLVPGNHDAYARATLGLGRAQWGEYMSGDNAPAEGGEHFPYERRRGPLAIIGLSTGVPTGFFMAWGRLGESQLGGLDARLEALGREQVFRVVLLHHPPVPFRRDRRKDLVDAARFRDVLRRRGAELVLHGHTHLRLVNRIEGPAGSIPVVGVPSASAIGQHDDPATYNLYRIAPAGNGWSCEMISRAYAPGQGGIAEVERRVLHPES